MLTGIPEWVGGGWRGGGRVSERTGWRAGGWRECGKHVGAERCGGRAVHRRSACT